MVIFTNVYSQEYLLVTNISLRTVYSMRACVTSHKRISINILAHIIRRHLIVVMLYKKLEMGLYFAGGGRGVKIIQPYTLWLTLLLILSLFLSLLAYVIRSSSISHSPPSFWPFLLPLSPKHSNFYNHVADDKRTEDELH